ncbi:hypothetical protein D3C85_1017160 [compost metagenome]
MILYSHHAELRCIRGPYRLPVQPVERTVLGELQQWPVLQAAIRRHQELIDRLIATFGMDAFEFFERDRLGQRERAGVGTTQLRHVRATAKRFADVFDQRADVGTFGAAYGQTCTSWLTVKQLQPVNSNRTRFALHYFTCTGQLVKRLPVPLEGRVHRRYLTDFPTKTWQDGFNVSATNGHFALEQNLTFGIGRSCGHTQLHDGFVALVGIEQVLRELGGLTEAQRQDAGRQWIEAAGVTGLFGIEQPAYLLQGGIGGKTQWLVEQDDATDVTANTFYLSHRLHLGVWF